LYWNYINYQANKSELTSQVQNTLDNAIESYYADIARGHSVTMTSTSDSMDMHQITRIVGSTSELLADTTNALGSLKMSAIIGDFSTDTTVNVSHGGWQAASSMFADSGTQLHINRIDTLAINLFASKIFVSMRNEILNIENLSGLVKTDFDSKNWPIEFGVLMRDVECESEFLACDTLMIFGETNQQDQLMVASQSALIPNGAKLEIHFSNISSILLRRSLIGIFLSFLLSAVIVFCLLYLFRTINQQKQLAEIKNDLISNITHEFKTPITTIGTALEGIQNFSGLDDHEKTKKYIGISNGQLDKLNTMVEKLLETASIDSEHLELKLTKINLTELVELQLAKYRLAETGKTFYFSSGTPTIMAEADEFHIESAIGNLLDNAVKYGGDEIEIKLNKSGTNPLTIDVLDSGAGVPKEQRVRIFDKFYRIPTGNVHDVKGFGIGLYYAKNIIEKHQGSLELMVNSSRTNFRITLPNAY
jgi:two-component system phosphate regulon sensor histidine kinase PhoR